MWFREILLYNGTFSQLFLGVTKSNTYINALCGVGLYYIAYLATNTTKDLKCAQVPGGDINQESRFQVNPYVSNGGGMLVQIWNGVGVNRITDYISYADGAPRNFSKIDLQEIMADTISGHEVWGSEWQQNDWVQGNGHFVAQTVKGTQSGGVPPQMYWNVPPSPNYPGGDLYSCDYDSTSNQCTLNG